ncbi:helix-turn-helix domain-containing protein [Oceanobacillus saliphilus]|uniref:helix-turn-helix domain-containing protein n=1 Tax=Oceanobacillus saliphilus TaxID=2925834 RepID=UPI00201D50F8|nr:helix-turn-helix domain-containing protein [Oceanobacillus saliphilus]
MNWLKNKWNKRYKSVFFRYFIILILLFTAIILLTNIVIYHQAANIIKTNAHDAQVDLLNQYKNSMNMMFNETREMMERTAQDTDIMNFIMTAVSNEEDENDTLVTNVQRKLKNVAQSNQMLISAYVYSAENNQIIGSNEQIYPAVDFYDQEWLEIYNEDLVGTHIMETREITDGYGNEFNAITFIHNLPYHSYDREGAIVVNINADQLYKRMLGPQHESDGLFYVMTREGEVILHPNKQMLYTNIQDDDISIDVFQSATNYFVENTNEKDQLYTYITSMMNNWKFVYSLSIDDLNGIVNKMTMMVISIIFVGLLLSIGLAYWLTRYVSSPIRKLVQWIPNSSDKKYDKEEYKDEYDYLDNVYQSIMHDNQQMETMISEFKPMIKDKLLDNLLTNKRISKEEVEKKLRLFDIHFSNKYYIVLTAQIDDYQRFYQSKDELESSMYKAELTRFIEKVINNHFPSMCGETETDKVAVVMNYSKEISTMDMNEWLVKLIQDLQEKVSERFPFTITIGLGRAYTDIFDVNKSYDESLRALEYKFYQGKDQIINVDDVDIVQDELYYYNNDQVKKLMNNMKTANIAGTAKELEALFEGISENGNIPYEHMNQLFLHLINSMIELLIDLNMDIKEVLGADYNIYEDFQQRETFEDVKQFFRDITNKVLVEIEQRKSDSLPDTSKKILEFIDSNYHRDIALQDVADWIEMSTNYTSKIIKDVTGKTYLEYVNMKRIDKAKQLLSSTQLTAKEIGFRVGFNSIQSFMRVFKKNEGITPGQYRDRG